MTNVLQIFAEFLKYYFRFSAFLMEHQSNWGMDIEGFREYCLSLPGVSEGTPFEKFKRGKFTILVFYVSGHMFCYFNIDDVKCDP